MRKKTALEAMKAGFLRELRGLAFLILLVSIVESTDKLTGEATLSIRFDVEVPKGHGDASRVRIPVKVAGEKLPLSEEALDNADYFVTFKNLEISYIDNRENVYFRAEAFNIKKGAA